MGSELALLGGPPAVSGRPEPWPPYLPEVAQTIDRMLRDGEVSYYGEEGWVGTLETEFEHLWYADAFDNVAQHRDALRHLAASDA